MNISLVSELKEEQSPSRPNMIMSNHNKLLLLLRLL